MSPFIKIVLCLLVLSRLAWAQDNPRILVRGQEMVFDSLTLQDGAPYISSDDKSLSRVASLLGGENAWLPAANLKSTFSIRDLVKLYKANLSIDAERNIWYIDPWVKAVSLKASEEKTTVQIQTSTPVQPSVTRLENPPRIVMDFAYAVLAQDVSAPLEAGGMVEKVEVAQFQAKPNIVRVVLHVTKENVQWVTGVDEETKAFSLAVTPLLTPAFSETGSPQQGPPMLGGIEIKRVGQGSEETLVTDLKLSAPVAYAWRKLRTPDNRIYIDFMNCLQGMGRSIDPDNPYSEMSESNRPLVPSGSERGRGSGTASPYGGPTGSASGLRANEEQAISQKSRYFQVIRVAQFQRAPVPVVRVVFRLTQPFHVDVQNSPEGLQVTVSSRIEDVNETLSGGGTTGASPMIARLRGERFNPRGPVHPNGITLVLDPGHGGSDPGARGRTLVEKEVTLDIAERVRERLTESGFTVIMTREGDQDALGYHGSAKAELQARVDVARRANAMMFISLHINSSDYSWPHGLQTHWYKSMDLPLASMIQRRFRAVSSFVDRGVMRDRFYVLNHSSIPAVLVEMGFISNAVDESKLRSSEVRDQLAEAISQGVVEYSGIERNAHL